MEFYYMGIILWDIYFIGTYIIVTYIGSAPQADPAFLYIGRCFNRLGLVLLYRYVQAYPDIPHYVWIRKKSFVGFPCSDFFAEQYLLDFTGSPVLCSDCKANKGFYWKTIGSCQYFLPFDFPNSFQYCIVSPVYSAAGWTNL